MIRINRQTDYAIRIILALTKHPPVTRIPTSQVRDEMLIPPALAQRIVAELALGKFINTYPGRNGCLEWARPAGQINLLQVVEFMQGKIDVSECLVRRQWAKLRKIIHNELENQTFDTLAQEASVIEDKIRPSMKKSRKQ